MITALNRQKSKIRISGGIVWLQLDCLLKFLLRQIELSFGARRIAYEVMQSSIRGKDPDGFGEGLVRFRISARAKIGAAQANVKNRFRRILLNCLLIKWQRSIVALILHEFFGDYKVCLGILRT